MNAVRTGQLPAVKVGRTYHVSRWGLTEFIGAKTAREVFDDSDLAKMKRAALTARVASLGAKK